MNSMKKRIAKIKQKIIDKYYYAECNIDETEDCFNGLAQAIAKAGNVNIAKHSYRNRHCSLCFDLIGIIKDAAEKNKHPVISDTLKRAFFFLW